MSLSSDLSSYGAKNPILIHYVITLSLVHSQQQGNIVLNSTMNMILHIFYQQ